MSDLFDFGFTAVTEDELDVVRSTQTTLTTTEAQFDKLYNAIVPLLNNLKLNPEKDYIYWPNRLEKVEAFESHLQKIRSGEL
jgi:hypothetical protein